MIWPALSYWLERPETVGWRVRVAGFRDTSGQLAPWIPADWSDEAKANIATARAAATSPELRRRGIELDVYEYDFLPVVRGIRLGNGDLIISLMPWESDGRASARGLDYEYIPHNEQTPSAEALRRIFDSWFNRAVQASEATALSPPRETAPSARSRSASTQATTP